MLVANCPLPELEYAQLVKGRFLTEREYTHIMSGRPLEELEDEQINEINENDEKLNQRSGPPKEGYLLHFIALCDKYLTQEVH